MIDLMLMGLFNAMVIFGVNKATFFEYCHPDDDAQFCDGHGVDKDSKMVAWMLRYYSLKWLGQFLSKPLFTCPPCMASIWGTLVYWLATPMSLNSLAVWPLYILMLSGLVALINSLTGYGNS